MPQSSSSTILPIRHPRKSGRRAAEIQTAMAGPSSSAPDLYARTGLAIFSCGAASVA